MKRKLLFSIVIISTFFSCKKNVLQQNVNKELSVQKNSKTLSVVDSPFIHPGIYHTQADLNRIKNVVAAHTEPYYTAYTSLLTLNYCQLSYTPHPVVNETYNVGQFEIRDDAMAAYYQAILGHITGNMAYFNKSKEIINAWTNTLQTFDQTDHLSAAPAAVYFSNAGEILKTNSTVWDSTSNNKLVAMLENIIYPPIAQIGDAGHGTGNMQAIIAMGVFCNDREKFNYAVKAYKNEPGVDGVGCYSVNTYIDISGQVNESQRDQPHAGGAVGGLLNTALIASNQNLDLFSYANNRLLAGLEHLAKFNLWFDVSAATFTDCKGDVHNNITSQDRRQNINIMTNIATAYYAKKGINAPYTNMMSKVLYPSQFGDDLLFRIDNSGLKPSFIVKRQDDPLDVQVYSDGNFAGGVIGHLAPGDYNNSALQAAGINNDATSSIKVPKGWSVTVYDGANFDGTSAVLRESSSFLGTVNLNDQVSSIKVRNTGGNPFKQIFAETYSIKSNLTPALCTDADGRHSLNYITDGSYATYNAVNVNGATGFEIRTSGPGGTVEIREAGPGGVLLGTIPVTATGDNNVWNTSSGILNSTLSGTKTIYLVFKGSGGYLYNVNWFKLVK